MIKHLFFDLDNTIFDFDKSERVAIISALKCLGIRADEHAAAMYSEINLSQWKRLERGEITMDELRRNRFNMLFDKLGVSVDASKANDVYSGLLGKTCFFIDGAQEVIRELSGICKLYIATNGIKEVQRSRIALSGIEKYFSGVFISQEIGYAKPSKEFFDVCFSKIPDFLREHTAIVGDSLTSDIKGGKQANITTILFDPHGRHELACADHVISSLAQILDIVK